MRRQAKAPSSGSSTRTARSVALFVCVFAAFLGSSASAALAAPPTSTIGPVANETLVTAEVSGTVDAHGIGTFWFFEVSTDGVAWSGTNVSGFTEGNSPEPVGGVLESLEAGQTYEVRLSAFNFEEFIAYPSETSETFTTDPAVAPSLALDSPGSVSYTSAHVSGTIDPEGGNTDAVKGLLPIAWELQVSADGSSWSTASSTTENPLEGANAESSTPIAVEADAANLTPATAYKVRLLAHYAGRTAVTEEADWEQFTTLAVAKPTITGLAVSGVTADSATFSAEIDPNGTDPAFDASWEFTCVPECHGAKGAALKGVVTGASEAIEADSVELEPNTEYTVTLKATNLGGTEEESTTFTTPAIAPGVRDRAAGPVGPEAARLNAEVNPHNSATTYWFEWGAADCAANPCQSLPATEDADAGEGNKFLHVSEQLTGLAPQTTYHFRVLAESDAGTTVGADQTFGTPAIDPSCENEARRVEQGSTYLPGCRAYEMVSPPDKRGADVLVSSSRVHTASDGDGFVFASQTAFADAPGTGVDVDYLSERLGSMSPTGWSTHAIVPQQGPLTITGVGGYGAQTGYDAEFSPDLSRAVYRYFGARPEDPNVQSLPNLYLRTDLRTPGNGTFQLLTQSTTPLNPVAPQRPTPAGASTDLSHVAFESPFNLTPDASGESTKLYEWEEGVTRLVGILPDGGSAPASVAGLGATNGRYTPHVVSADGSRIFFNDSNFGVEGSLFARLGGTVSVQLNRSEKNVPESPRPAQYRDASVDGTRVFFMAQEGLVEGDDNGAEDFYMWKQAEDDEAQGVAVDATGGTFALSLHGRYSGPIPFDAAAAEVEAALEGIHGPAPGEYPLLPQGDVSVAGPAGGPYAVTFEGHLAGVNMPELVADSSALTGGAATATATTTAPVTNLTRVSTDEIGSDSPKVETIIGASADGRYVYFTASAKLLPEAGDLSEHQNGGGIYLWHDGDLSYVGWLRQPVDLELNTGTIVGSQSLSTASRVTPDGRYLLFASHSDEGLAGQGGFAGADHGTSCTLDTGENGVCRELYLYDARSGALQCASCNLDGTPVGDAETFARLPQGASHATYHLGRPLSDDGRYVFFSTKDPLVAQDTNGASDVYAYDSVTETQRLLSSGTDPHGSYFLEATASGSDVFIATKERLSAWDADEVYDVYDVRVGGGFPEPLVATAPCAGDSCRAAAPAAPAAGARGSASLIGRGNPHHPKPCPKGKKAIRKGGKLRCVKKHHKNKRPTKNDRRAGR